MAEDTSGRYCKSCRYDLRGSVEPVCPECGRGFDPDDPTTFLTWSKLRVPDSLRIMECIVIVYPLVAMVIFTSAYALNAAQYGHWRFPYEYQADSVGVITFGMLSIAMFFLSCPSLIFSACVLAGSLWVRLKHYRGWRSLFVILAIPTAWTMLYLYLLHNPYLDPLWILD